MIMTNRYIDSSQYKKLCQVWTTIYTIYKEYHWLLDSYVSDFYVMDHWQELPKCWREALQVIDPLTLANIVDCSMPMINSKVVLPLSLISLRMLVKKFQIDRNQSLPYTDLLLQHSMLKDFKMLWKNVKLKKRHEIEVMSELCYKMSVQTKCYFVVDIGSGLGHLVRMLSYGYGLKTCGLEAKEELTLEARSLDKKMGISLRKHGFILCDKQTSSVHLNIKIKDASDGSDIITILEEHFGKNVEFGIIGLHPCGELSVTLLQLFVKYPQVKFINVVGCCYMKLNKSFDNFGYPVSNFSKQYGCSLTYSSLEVACHALEMYIQKLKSNKYKQLKVHAYRAALEKLITRRHPEMCHIQIGSVKYTDNLTFSEYVDKAISKLSIKISKSEKESDEIKNDLGSWNHVVTFYSLRLMLAPLVETIILLDRVLFIIESGSSGHHCYIASAFNPNISPRNYVISAMKK